MISVIIPVYNAERFLKKCLDSVLCQTYRDLEIVLVNDGSTDSSLDICKEYERKDSRIVLFSKENEGQGKARNLGIRECRGEYIAFVDSDDWLHPQMLEKLYGSLEKYGSNIAICNYYKTKLDSESEVQLVKESLASSEFIQFGDIVQKNKQALAQLPTYPWGKLYRKDLFLQYNLFFPSHFYEDAALVPLLYVRADRLSFVREGLYYYRNRMGSTVNQIATVGDRIECMETLMRNFEEQDLLEAYRDILYIFMESRAEINLRMAEITLRLGYEDFVQKQQKWFDKEFPEKKRQKQYPKICTFGSYSLMTVVKQLMGYKGDKMVEEYYGRQSLISCMSMGESLNKYPVSHENPMRQNCLIQDFSKKFHHKNPVEFKDVDYIFVDFLEERFPVGRYEDEYFTVSDAWQEMQSSVPISYTEIESFSEEWFSLWKEAADKFMNQLLRSAGSEKIVLVRMTLTEQTEENGISADFPDRERIKEINGNLEKCYDYFFGLNEKIKCISVKELPYYKTSSIFRHGAYPWHLGNEAYRLLAEEVRNQLQNAEEKRFEGFSI